MELVFVLVLLWLALSAFSSQVEALASVALYGVLAMGVLQLAAMWFFRAKLPPRAAAAVRFVPAVHRLARWGLFAVVGGGLLQVFAIYFLPRSGDQFLRPFAQHWAGWLAVVLITPLVEEILFRGCVFELLRSRFSSTAALLVSSALFGLAHGDLPTIVLAFCAGLIFGIAYLRTGSILPGLMGHVALNVGALLAIRAGLG